jgi:hypothetical protein
MFKPKTLQNLDMEGILGNGETTQGTKFHDIQFPELPKHHPKQSPHNHFLKIIGVLATPGNPLFQHKQHLIPRQRHIILPRNLNHKPPLRRIPLRHQPQRYPPQIIIQRMRRSAIPYQTPLQINRDIRLDGNLRTQGMFADLVA